MLFESGIEVLGVVIAIPEHLLILKFHRATIYLYTLKMASLDHRNYD